MNKIAKVLITGAVAAPVVVGGAGAASAHTCNPGSRSAYSHGSDFGYDVGYRGGALGGILDGILDGGHRHEGLLGGVLGGGYRDNYGPSHVDFTTDAYGFGAY